MRTGLSVIGALLVFAFAAAGIAAANEGTGSASSGDVAATIYVEYNVQTCHGYPHYAISEARVDWDRTNTSWLGSGTLQLVAIGSPCSGFFNNHNQSWAVTPSWGNTGNATHAMGSWHVVNWGYTGNPQPYGGSAIVGGRVYFNGTYGTYKAPTACALVNLVGLGC